MNETYKDQLTAIIFYNWTVVKVSLYDEEGIEGWRWTDHNGNDYDVIGNWDELPPFPESAREIFSEINNSKE